MTCCLMTVDHCELMDRMGLDQDSIMIIHMGGELCALDRLAPAQTCQGVFGDKQATLERFRTNYAKLPENVKARLVLENDEVSTSIVNDFKYLIFVAALL